MTESEARVLAAELEHHKYWRVIRVWEYSLMRWGVGLEHRIKPDTYGAIYGLMPAHMLAELLNPPSSGPHSL